MREYHKKIDDDPFNSLAALLVLRAHDVRNDRRIVAGIGFLLVIERRAFDTELHLHVRRGGDEICAHGGKFAMGIIDPAIKCVENSKLRRSREGGNPVSYVAKSLGPRLRGDRLHHI